MPAAQNLDSLFSLLRAYAAPRVFNPWRRSTDDDAAGNGPAARCGRLRAHFQTQPARLLLGEATGYQGCRISGIPFTSERLILAGAIPRIAPAQPRLSSRVRPWSEPSATVVWGALHQFGIAHDTLLWNAFPWHPYRDGEPCSNRTPGRGERDDGLAVLQLLLDTLPQVQLFAVGRHAQEILRAMGQRAVALRHPSMGGATQFRGALRAALTPHASPRRRRGQWS